jgi:iron(III) transport system ATP-binding protein
MDAVAHPGPNDRLAEPGARRHPALELSGVAKEFGKVVAVGGVDLAVAHGEFVTLLGPSGCGKSTLLRMVAGIEQATGGTIVIDGRLVSEPRRGVLVPPERRHLGMVFQSYAVWPHMTVARNVEYPLRYAKVPRSERGEQVRRALAAVALEGLAGRYPGELSGGQQQRVALARAIVGRPALLLLDEPLSNLDARLRENMRLELKRLQVELGLTALYVTHDQSEALAMSDRILVMDAGKVLQEGSPEDVYRRPVSLTVARFLGVKNILDGTVVDGGRVRIADFEVGATFPSGAAPGDPVTVAIRPDAFGRAENGHRTGPDVMNGTIDLVEFLGNGYEYQVTVGSQSSLIIFSRDHWGTRGDPVSLRLNDLAVAFARERA